MSRYIVPYFYIAEFLKSDYSTDASAVLISVIGFFNTIGNFQFSNYIQHIHAFFLTGMIVLGWVGDQKWCDVTKVYAICLFGESAQCRVTNNNNFFELDCTFISLYLYQWHELIVCGLSMFAIPLFTSSYTMLLILCAIFGITFASE